MKKEKLNVLFVAKNIPSPYKKTNRVIYDIAHQLSASCEIEFFYPRETVPFWLKNSEKFSHLKKIKPWEFEGFKIFPVKYIQLPFNRARFWLLRSLPEQAKKYIIEKKNIDLVHAHFLLPDGYIAYQIFKKFAIPYVLTIRNQDKRNFQAITKQNPDFIKAKKVLSNAKNIIVPNAGYQQFIKQNFNLSSTIVPHGIDATVFNSASTSHKNNEAIVITVVAAAIKRKNIAWVIRAFKNYDGDQKLKLNIVGDGPELDKLKKLAKNDSRIKFHGRITRNQVLGCLRTSDIFALPSINETFGIVYLEGAATQNAIIGMKGEGVWGVFEANTEMLFCKDFEEFRQQLHQLIKDSSLRHSLASNAYRKARLLHWDNIKDLYLKIYSAAIN